MDKLKHQLASITENSSNNAWNWNNSNWNNNNKNNNNFRARPFSQELEDKYQIPLEAVFDAYYDCIKHNKNSYGALEFKINYWENLIKLWEDLNSGRYEIGPSICFIVTRPKYREVFAADFRDRIVHHLVMRRIEPIIEHRLIDNTFNCRKGKGNLKAAQTLQKDINKVVEQYGECYIGKFDLEGFFMTISKPLLWDILYNMLQDELKGDDKYFIIKILRKMVFHSPQRNCIRKSPSWLWKKLPKYKSLFDLDENTGIAIGNLPSQILSNLYLSVFDHIMINIFPGYGRYCDDFYVLSPLKEHILLNLNFMRTILSIFRLKLHPKKFYLQHHTKGVPFVGFFVYVNRLYTGNRCVFNFKECIKTMDKTQNSVCKVNSYLGFMRHTKSFNIRREIVKDMPLRCVYPFLKSSLT